MKRYNNQMMSEFATDKFKEEKKVEYAYHSDSGEELKIVYKIENDDLIKSTDLVEVLNWLYKRGLKLEP